MPHFKQQLISDLTTKRILASLIDIAPILIVIFLIFYYFLDFDNDIVNIMNNPDKLEYRAHFRKQQINVHVITFFIWILSGMLMDCSKTQGTFGKVVMGLKVTTSEGHKLDCTTAATRNLAKLASTAPLCLGFIWTLFNRNHMCWHDSLTKTQLTQEKDIIA